MPNAASTMNDQQQRPPMGRPLRWLWLAVAVIVLDLLTKYMASHFLNYAQPVEVLPFFNLTLLHNPGAAFSFLADHPGWQRWFFATVAVGASIGLTIWLSRLRADEKLLAIALPLIIGGALGNLYDRLVHGYVVDFLSFHAAGWYYPAFNVADIGITLGAIGLIWESIMGDRRRKKAA
ncbi:signal peptidase II [Halomonas sp. M1]|uniref:signal peptidase II n=1 Tax=unclassified Halomonas TaxID=2609666 RepID=UPI00023A54CC|nr:MULTISPECIES: signal peptidase II [unclassified Halomonas]AVI61550.1 signal peptidase II [Halomonas sp. GFAJ-1]EHK61361.1 lipoprotein signal peptidase [Halomonas sp. GFAJ-1]MDP3535336.1 signal peptidase II [Halomonas sp.]WFE70773.1 signal peptidase II [Halomonas sp. M1]